MKFVIIPALLLSFAVVAQTPRPLPQIGAPAELSSGEYAEGTVTRMTAEDVAQFLPWAQNARNQLTRSLNQARNLPLRERPAHIERAVRAVVERSGGRQYQMFLRFALNRGMLLVDELERNVNMNEIGSQESALDLLQKAIEVGLEFYESDLAFQERAQSGETAIVLPYAQFGVAFMQKMYPGVVNVLDAGAQYRLLFKLIEMTNWDLSRDAQAARYAETIVETYEMTVDLPEQPSQDDRANMRMIRRLNGLKIVAPRPDVAAPVTVAPPTPAADAPVPAVAVAENPIPGVETVGSIARGKFVLETYGTWSTQRVTGVASDGTIQLADGEWYNRSYIKRLVPYHAGLRMGDVAVETYSAWSHGTVRYLSDEGDVMLSDGDWYNSNYIKRLATSHGGISVGDVAAETYGTWSHHRVTHITTDGYFRLADGEWYNRSYIKRLAPSVGGYSVNARVVETYGTRSERTITHVCADGSHVRLSDGVWYARSYVMTIE